MHVGELLKRVWGGKSCSTLTLPWPAWNPSAEAEFWIASPLRSGQEQAQEQRRDFQGHTGVGGGGIRPQPTVVFTKCCCTPSISKGPQDNIPYI